MTQTCARHPKVATYLRCAACDTPICEKCAVETAVGYKCRDCGTHHTGAYSPPKLWRALAVVLIGLAAGLIGVLALSWASYWGIVLAVIYGRFLGTLSLKVSGRKVGPLMDCLTGGSIALGGVAPVLLLFFSNYHALLSSFAFIGLPVFVIPLVIAGVTAASAISGMRFPWGNWWC